MNVPESLHSAMHSVLQSAVNEVLHKGAGTTQGLNEHHPMMQEASSALAAHLEGKVKGGEAPAKARADLEVKRAEAKVAGHEERVR